MTIQQKIQQIKRHTDLVDQNCRILGYKLFELIDNETVRFDLTRDDVLLLFKLGKIHDADKLEPFMIDNLWPEAEKFTAALKRHQYQNGHHPEHWANGINDMPTVYVAEMVCDCAARAQEFGSDVRTWFHNQAPTRYGFSFENNEVGLKIDYFLDILLTKKFS